MSTIARIAAILLLLSAAPWNVSARNSVRTVSRASLLDKIQGGWAGQMIGVAYGAPTEFQSKGQIGEWNLQWKPGMLENTIDQDDLYVEMTFAKVMDDQGIDAPIAAYGEAFRSSRYPLWHANAAARRLLNQGIPAPLSGHPKYNIHANDIDFQIEADFIGLMCPGLPRFANRLCNRVGRVMNYGDGLYGGMFVCGMYSSAFFESDPRKVVEAGLAGIPTRSGYGRVIRDLLQESARHPDDWRAVWQIIENRWNRDDPCPEGALADFNIEARLNGAYIAFGLLFGEGDFERTMEISTRCGQDSDCNPSSAAGILGVMLGYQGIPDRFKADFPKLAGRKFAFTEYAFDDIVLSTERRALEAIRQAGGTVAESDVRIPLQSPRAPKLEQWNPGRPIERVLISDAAWTWTGAWTRQGDLAVSHTSGNEAVLRFDGVGIAIQGRLDPRQGRAAIHLDGRRIAVADAFNVERTHDNNLWHAFGLKPGSHTLRIVTRADTDPRSGGADLALQSAVIYGPSEVP